VCYTPRIMRSLRMSAALFGFAACLLVSPFARAADRVAALVPQIRPAAPNELRDRFHEAITRGLQTGSDEVIPAAEVRLRLGASEEMINCVGVGPCVARSAQALRLDRVVASEIDVSGKDYQIRLRLLDPVGRELAKIEEPCDICTVKEADDAIARAATKLASTARTLPTEGMSAVPPPPPQPKAETPPPPQPKAETPPPPPTPETTPSPTTTPTVTTQPEQKMFPWRALAITSLVVGVVGIAVGAPLVAIDGQPTCSLPNPMQTCPNVYNTVGGGATLLTLGIAGALASVPLFILDHRARAKRLSVMMAPTSGGALLSASGRF
jgi:hypothetical protein